MLANRHPLVRADVIAGSGTVLLLEALAEVRPESRSPEQWRSIGTALARLHQVHDERFGSSLQAGDEAFDGFFGPLHQDNRPVPTNRWADFYAARRLLPLLRTAVDSGHLPPALAAGVERLADRLPSLCGPPPRPALLHGDAQQNNFVTTAPGHGGAVLIDTAPYFGHPEVDLALLDYFAPVPDDVFVGYRAVAPVDPGFEQRRELWRLHGYLAVVAVAGGSPFGRDFLDRVAAAVAPFAGRTGE
jgi:fructosamine-3-kinase